MLTLAIPVEPIAGLIIFLERGGIYGVLQLVVLLLMFVQLFRIVRGIFIIVMVLIVTNFWGEARERDMST